MTKLILMPLFILIASQNAFAKLQIGKISHILGTQSLVNGKQSSESSPLFWGDTVVTDAKTTAEMVIYPAFALRVEPSSQLKIIGNLIEKNGRMLLTSTAVQILKGQLSGEVYKNENQKNDIKIFGRRSVSSIRGTTFSISCEATDDDVTVFEGEVHVENLKDHLDVAVVTGESFVSDQAAPVKAEKNKPILLSQGGVEKIWQSDSSLILASHAHEAKRYREILQNDVKSTMQGLKKDAKAMFQTTKGTYDQFKTK